METSPSSSTLPLRQLRWPSLPAVDLLDECHWLVTLDARNPNPPRKPTPIEADTRHNPSLKFGLKNEIPTIPTKKLQSSVHDLSKHKSPYRQSLHRPKSPAPSPGSPAQRAAKSILKLKEGLLRLDGTNGDQLDLDHQDIHDALAQQPVSRPVPRSRPETSESPLTRSPSPSRVKTPVRSPTRKKKKRPPSREERELVQKQERLAEWLNANPDTDPADDPIDAAPSYSVEVEARIESVMQCRGPVETGVRLWDDPVRSMLAAEMTSESAFGGAVPTRALAFQSPRSSSPGDSPPKPPLSGDGNKQLLNVPEVATAEDNDEQLPPEEAPEATTSEHRLSVQAQKVFGLTNRQVADGAVADALETLEAGIRQALSTSQAHLDAASASNGVGFNYSELAHRCATKLQICYRAHHRRRVNRLILLQRQWRWWDARRRALNSVQYAHKLATVIQRRYRPWQIHIKLVRSAVRIQRCFRLFEENKFLVSFRRVCRLLLARQARRRQVKTRIRVVGKFVLLWRRRRRCITLIQSLWRRRCAQDQLATLLAHASEVERARRCREDEFVAAKLALVRVHFREFLATTKRGRELVCCQADKPWLRFRRLRYNKRLWDDLPLSDKVEAVARVLPDRSFRGLQKRALCQMVVGRNKHLPPSSKVLKVSATDLEFLADSFVVSDTPTFIEPAGCCPWCARARKTMQLVLPKLSRRAATMWWSVAVYPEEYCVARFWPMRRLRRELAQRQLEDDFARVLTGFLRVWFRRIDNKANTPPYTCEWCSEPFGTSREFFAHNKCTAARNRAEAEWKALSSDLHFVRRATWNVLSKQPHDSPVRTDIHAFDLEAASVRRLRRTRSRRKALIHLVAVLEACTAGDSLNTVIPLDLASFVLRYLDEDENLHPLLLSAENQLVRWSTLVGRMEVKSPRQTSEGSGRESRWIRKDDLRARLINGSEWRGVLSRLHRSISRRALPSRWKELLVGRGSKTTSQHLPASLTTAERVRPIAT